MEFHQGYLNNSAQRKNLATLGHGIVAFVPETSMGVASAYIQSELGPSQQKVEKEIRKVGQ